MKRRRQKDVRSYLMTLKDVSGYCKLENKSLDVENSQLKRFWTCCIVDNKMIMMMMMMMMMMTVLKFTALKIYCIHIFKFMFIGSKICCVYSTPCDKFYIHGPQQFSSQMVVMELKLY